MDQNINDNEKVASAEAQPDAHGQAAMLLIESLLHGLIERSVITLDDAIEITEVAADVKADIGEEMGDSHATMRRSLGLLNAISQTFNNDVDRSASAAVQPLPETEADRSA